MSRVRAATAVHRRHQQLLGQLQQHKLVQLQLLLILLLCFPAIIDCSSSSIFIPNWTWTSSSSKRDAQQQQGGGGGAQMMDHLLLSLGWSRWSEWSPCSAKCGLEGVQWQSRRCLNLHCSGPRTRHRVCRAELKDCAYPLGNFSSPPVVEPLSLECALRSTAENPLLAPPGLPQNCSQLLCLSASSASASASSSSAFSVSAPLQSPKNRRQQPLLLSFAHQLRDGQRCRLATDPDPEGQLAVCLHGRCQPVGCDSLVGSRTREDQCGVCGGDGRSCAGKLFRWRDTGHFSPCDRSCGPGGVRVSVSACVNTNTQRLVPDRMCADQPRPRPQVAKCPHVVCPANAHPFGGGVDTRHLWLTSEWSDCSVTCGPGEQRREVFCAEQSRKRPTGDDGIENNRVLAEMAEENQEAEEQGVDQEEAEEEEERRRVADQYCWHSQRPLETRKCDAGPCPQWAMGDWGPCQAVCGRGTRRRPVQCLAGQQRFHDWHCLLLNGGNNQPQQPKPAEEQPCWTGTSCSGGSGGSEEASWEQRQQQQQMQQLLGNLLQKMSIISAASFLLLLTFHLIIADQQPAAIHRQRNRALDNGSWRRNRMAHKTTADVGESELWSSSSVSRESVHAALEGVQSIEEPEGTGGGDEQMSSSGPRFLAGAWGPCSASCGPGIRSRPVDCMAPQPISGQLLKLPDYECQQLGQPQPGLFQACQLAACPPRAAGAQSAIRSLAQPFPPPPPAQRGPAFRWEHGQWTLCSASCLGGRQKSPVLCLELATGKSVAWAKCQQEAGAGPKPEELIRGCNRHSCPPDWEIGPWSACSHSCGGGLRTRRVRCARAVSRTGASTLILPDAQCPGGQRPADEEPCGMVDCAPEWTLGHWGQCSSSCGPGEQRRTLSCLRRDSMGQVQEKQPEDCVQAAGGQKPPATSRLCNLGPCPAAGQRQSNHREVETEKSDAAADPAASSPFAYSEPSGPAAVDPRPPPPPQSLALLGPAKDQPVMEAGEEEEQEMADEESEQRKAETLMEPAGAGEEGRQPRRLTLRVGGFANLYEGTSLKVKCPTQRNGDGGGNANNGRRKIEWTKNGHPLRQSARVKVSVNGALRIFRARQKDAGIYACQTTMATAVDGRQQRQQQQMGNVTLRFKPNPAGGGRSGGGGEENRTGRQAAKQLLQRIRDSLYRLGEHTLYHRLASVHDPGQVRVDFAVSDWGQCEQPDCNQAEGIQIRQLKCQLHVGDEAAYLEQSICEAFGVPRPPASRPCTDDGRCPRWTAGPWSDCDGPQSRCVRQATALQRREVRCTFGNGTETSPGACPRKSRPKLKRECQNANCSAEWRPSVWGKCSKRCGDGGVQMRLLRCVWRGTRKPAGPNCERGQRPPAIRACQAKRPLAECPADREEAEKEAAERANETGMMGRGKSELEQMLEEEEENEGNDEKGQKHGKVPSNGPAEGNPLEEPPPEEPPLEEAAAELGQALALVSGPIGFKGAEAAEQQPKKLWPPPAAEEAKSAKGHGGQQQMAGQKPQQQQPPLEPWEMAQQAAKQALELWQPVAGMGQQRPSLDHRKSTLGKHLLDFQREKGQTLPRAASVGWRQLCECPLDSEP